MEDTRRCSRESRLLIGVLVACALALVAADDAPRNPKYLPEAQQRAWAERLEQAQNDLKDARARVDRLETAYAEAQHDAYPRGEERAELEEDLREARQDLAEARDALPRLVEEARRAGVLPGVLRPYRD